MKSTTLACFFSRRPIFFYKRHEEQMVTALGIATPEDVKKVRTTILSKIIIVF